jgi:hypothetical protein
MIKRQMYGRAGFTLLRLHILLSTVSVTMVTAATRHAVVPPTRPDPVRPD